VTGSDADPVVDATVVEFAYDYWVDSPLWVDHGNVDTERARRTLGLDEDLVNDLDAWVADMDDLEAVADVDGRLCYVLAGAEWYDRVWRLDVEARALVARVEEQAGLRTPVGYRPWLVFPAPVREPGAVSVADDRDL